MASDAFLVQGNEMSKRLGIYWPHLLMNMNTESDLLPSAINAGSGAAGLIQIMPANLRSVGFSGSPREFASLSDVQQLPFIERFLRDKARHNLHSVGRLHQALFVPATLTMPGSFPDSPSTPIAGPRTMFPGVPFAGALQSAYTSNFKGFDKTRKGFITVGDLEEADRAKALRSPNTPYQRAIARLRTLIPGLVEQGERGGGGATEGGRTFPWLAAGLVAAAGIGGAMLLHQTGQIALPTWTPRWMRTA